ncbi:hypothetical protein E4K73_01485 [Streptomyces sp. IB201691-2A2]|nr:hypothetical protein E4K73_01485 [Streptomyces sp. IB201691-2A2]
MQRGPPVAPARPDPAAAPAPGTGPASTTRRLVALGVVVELVDGVLAVLQGSRVLPARFGRCTAPRASEGAIEVPLARVAVVHDAGRLNSAQVTFTVTAVKVLC